jgi:hypothetical protein
MSHTMSPTRHDAYVERRQASKASKMERKNARRSKKVERAYFSH